MHALGFFSRAARRLGAVALRRESWITCARDLRTPVEPGCRICPTEPVEFRVNDPAALRLLRAGGQRFDLSPRSVRDIDDQVARGDAWISGWCGRDFAYCGWIQFGFHSLIRGVSEPLSPVQAVIHRCFTAAEYRGLRVYPAALQFKFRWLAARGYRRAIINFNAANRASRRGIELAGMSPLGDYEIWWIFGWRMVVLPRSLRRELADWDGARQ